MKLKYFDNYLMITMSLVAVICIFLLYGQNPYNPKNQSGQELAFISDQFNVVKKKRDFFQSWSDAGKGDTLSNNDEIYTHESSGAVIKFQNGNKVELSENSLLKIKSINQVSNLTLEKGNIIAELSENSKKLEIVISGKTYSFESSKAKIQIEPGKTNNKFVILEGSAQLKINDKQTEIKKNEVITENTSDGALIKEIIPVVLSSPINKSNFYFVQNTDISFRWTNNTTLANNEEIKLLISKERNFQNIIMEKSISNLNEIKLNFSDEGKYYFKITTDNKVDSVISEFNLIKETPPTLRVSNDYFIQNKIPQTAHFSWDRQNTKQFMLEISRPNHNLFAFSLEENYFDLNLTEFGNYQVRIKVFDKLRPDALWSEKTSITYQKIDKLELKTSTNLNQIKISYQLNPIKTKLFWESSVELEEYTVKIINPKNEVLIQKTNSPSIEFEMTTPGVYTWEVQGNYENLNSNTLAGKITFKRPVSLTTLPKKGAIIELDRPDQLVNFNWQKLINKTNAQDNYQIEISDNEDFFKPIISKDVETNSFTTNLEKTGKYFWRVKIKNNNESDYSEPVSVEIKPSPMLQAPENVPDLKIKLKFEDVKSTFIKIIHWFFNLAYAADTKAIAEWNLVHNPKVKTYIIEIYSDNEAKNLITKIESNSSHIVWKEATPGIFYWKIAYKDFWERTTVFSKISKLELIDERIPPKKIVQKPLPLPKPLLKELPHEIIVTTTSKKSFSLYYRPSLYSLNQIKDNNEIDISGTAVNSLGFNYNSPKNIWQFNEIEFQGETIRGKVFNDKTFTDIKMGVSLNKNRDNFFYGPALFIARNNQYSVTNRIVNIATHLDFAAGILAGIKFNNILIKSNLAFGSTLLYSIESVYSFQNNVNLGILFEGLSRSNSNQNNFSLMLGKTFFLNE
jgi:mannose-6-phosphate isomerase-like protein (cupin superfamily)